MSPPAQLLIGLILIVAAAAGGFYHGTQYQDGRQAQLDRARLEREAFAQAEFWEGQRTKNARIESDLNTERANRAADARNYRDKLRSVTSASLIDCGSPDSRIATAGDRPASAPAPPVDKPRFTADAVRLWNGALSLGTSEADRAGWVDGANTGTGPVEIADALQNLADNAELLGMCRAREAGWRRWAQENGLDG